MITELTFPSTVKEIEENAFKSCTALASIFFAEGSVLERIGNSAFEGTGLFGFISPASLKILGNGAFQNCKNLSTVRLKSNLELIGDGCFSGTVLSNIEIYQGIKTIGKNAFPKSFS